MQERQVTAAGKNYVLQDPFFVLATQNPIEQEGTYPLPEAQLDRFMYQVTLDYPSFDEEVQILKQTTQGSETRVSAIMNANDVISYQKVVREVPVPDSVFEYVVGLVNKSRPSKENQEALEYIAYGAGPRAGQNLILGAKCHALMNGKFSVDREDVKAVSKWVLSHRVVLNFKAEAEGIKTEEIIKNWL